MVTAPNAYRLVVTLNEYTATSINYQLDGEGFEEDMNRTAGFKSCVKMTW